MITSASNLSDLQAINYGREPENQFPKKNNFRKYFYVVWWRDSFFPPLRRFGDGTEEKPNKTFSVAGFVL